MAQIAIGYPHRGIGRAVAAVVLVAAGLAAGLGISRVAPLIGTQAAQAGPVFGAADVRSALDAQRASERGLLALGSGGQGASNAGGFASDNGWATFRAGERSR